MNGIEKLNEIDRLRIKIVYVAVVAVCWLATVGVGSLCLTMFFRNYADPAVLTAIISITSGLVGSLSTIMMFPRPQQQAQPTAEVTVSNPPDQPVPVTSTSTTTTVP